MAFLRPSWQLSVTVAALLAVTALLCRRLGPRLPRGRGAVGAFGAFAGEFTLVMSLLGLWQYVGQFVHTRVAGAFERAHHVIAIQRALHLPSEVWVQHLVMPHVGLVKAMNYYYGFAHLNSMGIFLVWMWVRHRDRYGEARVTVAGTTLLCLLVQAVPVAPPRMLTDAGFVDVALQYGQSVYGPFGSGIANQLAAMPSVHVAWAVIVGWYAVRASSSPWRWLAPVHTVVTVLVVVATANHWWLDGIVAVGLMALVVPAQQAVRRLVARRPQPLRLPGLVPAGAPSAADAGE